MLAFSTCWNSARHLDGEAMLQEIRDLGFEHVELGHGTRLSLVEGILRAVDNGVVKICSVHNFCPLPPGRFDAAPNAFLFSARDPLEWDNAVRYTRATIDFAAKIGARAVVVHAGKVPVRKWTEKLLELTARGQQQTPKYQRVLERAVSERARHQPRYFAQAIQCLQAIVPYAAERGIQLGVETRYGLEEIPDESEMEEILHLYPNQTVGFWLDCGHAQVRQHLGVGSNQRWLQQFLPRLVGFHLHDVIPPGVDHLPPGEGVVDFARLAPHLADEIPAVLELGPAVELPRVRAGVQRLKILLRDRQMPAAAAR
jgi:sugar phosphate isomerase/epimerase